jgi:hypothetical protein
MRRQTVQVVQVLDADAAVEAGAEALGGLGGVLGDVPGDLLSRQLPGLALGSGDVADVELLAPAGIPARLSVQRRAGYSDRRDRQPQGLLEEGGRERRGCRGQAAGAAAVGGGVQADDGVEVDRAASLELGHLGIGDPGHPPKLVLPEADQPA